MIYGAESVNIYRLIRVLEFFNWTVDRHNDDIPDTVIGRAYYDEKRIIVNAISAEYALKVLCHEVGHVLFYYLFLCINPEIFNKTLKEKGADVLGFIVSKIMRFGFTWKEYNTRLHGVSYQLYGFWKY